MHIPTATYRLQFCPDFGFSSAKEATAYLSYLGVSTIYASPIFMAREGSDHGYDIVDHTRLNPELGTRQEFDDLIGEVQSKGMSWLQDFVPNHMAYSQENHLLMDVLACGQGSRYSRFFDIDFNHVNPSLKARVLAPFLGTNLEEALRKGEVVLGLGRDGLYLQYYDLRLPLNHEAYLKILAPGPEGLRQGKGTSQEDSRKLLAVLDTLKSLPSEVNSPEELSKGFREAQDSLWELYQRSPGFKDWLNRRITGLNQETKQPDEHQFFPGIISRQFYRLCHFQVAMQEINYRRFFTINDLICLNMENRAAFEHVHALVFELLEASAIQGLRIDHLDGLYDPARYLSTLRQKAPDSYIIVEKILGEGEGIPADWPVQGNTGYDFLNYVNGIFVDPRHKDEFTRIYQGFLGRDPSSNAQVAEKKRLILENEMNGDLDNLTYLALSFLAGYWRGDDITRSSLKKALGEILVRFPVYRSYLSPSSYTQQDKDFIREAFARNLGNKWIICLAPRLLTSLINPGQIPCGRDIWEDTSIDLPEGAPEQWHEVLAEGSFTGGKNFPVGEILQFFPGALLISKE